jgi:hypothetical protein
MKRQHFNISLNGSIVATTFAWNSAIRAIEELVRVRSRSRVTRGGPPVVYNLVSSASVRDPNDKYRMLSGHRTWQSDTETLHYAIALRGSAR